MNDAKKLEVFKDQLETHERRLEVNTDDIKEREDKIKANNLMLEEMELSRSAIKGIHDDNAYHYDCIKADRKRQVEHRGLVNALKKKIAELEGKDRR